MFCKHEYYHSMGPLECKGTDDTVGIKRCRLCCTSSMYNMDEEKLDAWKDEYLTEWASK